MNKERLNQAKALFLLAAGVSLLLSVGLFFLADDKINGVFVGLWVPSILALGIFLTQGIKEKDE